MPTEAALAVAVKAFGAAIGAGLALAFQPPKGLREFTTRALSGLIVGTLAAPQVRAYLEWPNDVESAISAGALAGFLSWWAMGAATKVAGGWKGK